MAKFRFYQDKEVKTWVRDYYNVEAETLDEAIEYVKNMGCPFEDDECKKDTKVEFEYRDTDWTEDILWDFMDSAAPKRYSIFSKDLDAIDEESEVVHYYQSKNIK